MYYIKYYKYDVQSNGLYDHIILEQCYDTYKDAINVFNNKEVYGADYKVLSEKTYECNWGTYYDIYKLIKRVDLSPPF